LADEGEPEPEPVVAESGREDGEDEEGEGGEDVEEAEPEDSVLRSVDVIFDSMLGVQLGVQLVAYSRGVRHPTFLHVLYILYISLVIINLLFTSKS
jgi:hypothetical protein